MRFLSSWLYGAAIVVGIMGVVLLFAGVSSWSAWSAVAWVLVAAGVVAYIVEVRADR